MIEWLDEQADANGRVERTEIVPNLLSPALVQLSRTRAAARRKIEGRQRAVRFHFGRRSAAGRGGEIDIWLKQDLPEAVYWVERSKSRRGHTRFVLCASPIDVGPALREHLFDEVPSVIMTSATLGVGRKRRRAEGRRRSRSGKPRR